MNEVLLSTTESIPGYKVVEVLGIVMGNTVRAKHIGQDILAGLRNLVGGEIKEYTEMLTEAREEAIKRMCKQAQKLGANAVIGVRLTTAEVLSGAAEILAYGTAAKVEPKFEEC